MEVVPSSTDAVLGAVARTAELVTDLIAVIESALSAGTATRELADSVTYSAHVLHDMRLPLEQALASARLDADALRAVHALGWHEGYAEHEADMQARDGHLRLAAG